MAEYQLILPAMGEGIMEATLVGWLCQEGDQVQEDQSVLEIATDKVDSEVPTPVEGRIIRFLKQKGEVAKIGEAVAIIETAASAALPTPAEIPAQAAPVEAAVASPAPEILAEISKDLSENPVLNGPSAAYISPLVRTIAQEEGLSEQQLASIAGSGHEGRITKEDILAYLGKSNHVPTSAPAVQPQVQANVEMPLPMPVADTKGQQRIEMDRTRKLIAQHMVHSKQVAPHVTSFIETDVTGIVRWRAKNKTVFEQRYQEKLTYMPIFVQAVVKAIQDFPMINVSVDGDFIVKKNDINIGFATALPDGNLIVPVIKNADRLSLSGLAKAINDLAHRARNKQLKPQETQGGTYTISNIGGFGNLMGTPIINQPQVAILAIGSIEKKPAVLETPEGDVIAIRQKMFMSHAYDHRVVDGALGGLFLKKVHDYLAQFDPNTEA
jgi:2-oxoglutarate dehydrogenase E2 component (dihydrolipoamide succinyltransferase)